MFDGLKKTIKKMFNSDTEKTQDFSIPKIYVDMNLVLTEADNGLPVAVALRRINKEIKFFSTLDHRKLCTKIHMPFEQITSLSMNFPKYAVVEVEKITLDIINKINPTEIITRKEESFTTGIIALVTNLHDNMHAKTKIIQTSKSIFDGFIANQARLKSRLSQSKKKKNSNTLGENEIFQKINNDNISMFDFEQIIESVLSQKKSLISSLAAFNMGNSSEVLQSVEQMQKILKSMTIKEKKDHSLLFDISRINRITKNDYRQKIILEKFIENWPNLKGQFKQMLNMFSQFKNNPTKMFEMLKNFKKS